MPKWWGSVGKILGCFASPPGRSGLYIGRGEGHESIIVGNVAGIDHLLSFEFRCATYCWQSGMHTEEPNEEGGRDLGGGGCSLA